MSFGTKVEFVFSNEQKDQGMKIEETRIKAYDKIDLFTKCWLPASEAEGVIILVHSLGEHINRYNHWAKRFNNTGWAVVGFDLRGHGNSGGRRGNGSYQAYLHDIDSVFNFVHKRFGDIPLVLYGHSMGGNLALGYQLTRKPDISRLIVTSPWLKLKTPPHETILLFSKLISKLIPSLSVSNSLNPHYFSRNLTVCDEYKKDPLVHNKVSLGSFLQLQDWASVILKNKHKINVPLLLLHGGDDHIASWKGSYIFARETSESTHCKIWDKCYHELHNDLCNEEVFEYISVWLSNIQKSKLRANVG